MDAKIKRDDQEHEKLYQENLKETSHLRKQLKERAKKMGLTGAD